MNRVCLLSGLDPDEFIEPGDVLKHLPHNVRYLHFHKIDHDYFQTHNIVFHEDVQNVTSDHDYFQNKNIVLHEDVQNVTSDEFLKRVKIFTGTGEEGNAVVDRIYIKVLLTFMCIDLQKESTISIAGNQVTIYCK